MIDIAEQLAQSLYGKSAKANAECNQSDDFKAGYAVGAVIEDAMQAISQEFIRRGEVADEGFDEWKRGMWAARVQRVCAEAEWMHE